MEKRCKNCKYWEKEPYDKGRCRINPPVLLPFELLAEPEKAILDNFPCFVGLFPKTLPGDWCGRFEAKEEAKQE